ncbi:hypothetical protein AUTU_45700 (plasmid) [Aureibacter tunicatorum]|nr:hypothetical protein AUTU_45700 [Aureibacter tunicatorum]
MAMSWKFAQAQSQTPFFLKYQNPQLINPGYSAIDDALSGHAGIKMTPTENETFQTYFVNVDFRIPFKENLDEPIMNTRRGSSTGKVIEEQKSQVYKNGSRYHGFSLAVISDNYFDMNQTQGQLAYAYHMPVSLKSKLSAGLGLKFMRNNFTNSSWWVRDENDRVYEDVVSNEPVGSDMYLSGGIVWHGKDFFLSFSTDQSIYRSENSFGSVEPQNSFTFGAGKSIRLSRRLDWDNSFFLGVQNEYIEPVLNSHFRFDNQLSFGGQFDFRAYSSFDVSYRFGKSLEANYVFVMPMQTKNSLKGHLIGIKYRLGNSQEALKSVW